eukprot:161033-Pelagomonas_calceolata.AAC.4
MNDAVPTHAERTVHIYTDIAYMKCLALHSPFKNEEQPWNWAQEVSALRKANVNVDVKQPICASAIYVIARAFPITQSKSVSNVLRFRRKQKAEEQQKVGRASEPNPRAEELGIPTTYEPRYRVNVAVVRPR